MSDIDAIFSGAAPSFANKLTPTVKGELVRFPTMPKAPKAPTVIVPGGLTFVAIGDMPETEPDFLVDGLIETDCLASVFGDPGHGKSFFAIDMGLCVATGREFHGKEVKQGSVFYVAGEGHNGLGRRSRAWAKHLGESLDGAPLFASTKAANFLDPAHAEFVGTQIDGLALAHGAPNLIIIDTLARNFGDGDENSTADMNAFVAAMDELHSRYPDTTVLVVHHTGHAEKGRSRGSMAFKAALDAEYQVAKSDDVVTVTCKKMKEGEEPEPISFKLESVELGTDRKGKPFGSAVLVPCDAPAKGAAKLTGNKKLGLETFHMAARDSGIRDEGGFRGVHNDDWREMFKRKHTGDNDNSKWRAFDRAKKDLVSGGYLTVNNDLYQIGASYPFDAGELI